MNKAVRLMPPEQLRNITEMWRTLTVGAKPVEEILKLLDSKAFPTKVWAVLMVKDRDFSICEQIKNLKLCFVSVRDLGFSERPNTKQLHDRAREFNLSLCPPEVGPLLWISSEEVERTFNIAMDPIFDGGGMRIFKLVFAKGTKFHGLHPIPAGLNSNKKWNLDTKFVFVLNDF